MQDVANLERRLEERGRGAGHLADDEYLLNTYLGRFDHLKVAGQLLTFAEFLARVDVTKGYRGFGICGYTRSKMMIATKHGITFWLPLRELAEVTSADDIAITIRMSEGFWLNEFRLRRYHGRTPDLPRFARALVAQRDYLCD